MPLGSGHSFWVTSLFCSLPLLRRQNKSHFFNLLQICLCISIWHWAGSQDFGTSSGLHRLGILCTPFGRLPLQWVSHSFHSFESWADLFGGLPLGVEMGILDYTFSDFLSVSASLRCCLCFPVLGWRPPFAWGYVTLLSTTRNNFPSQFGLSLYETSQFVDWGTLLERETVAGLYSFWELIHLLLFCVHLCWNLYF